MTDGRPEITVRSDGAFVVLELIEDMHHKDVSRIRRIPLSETEAFGLQCDLATAISKLQPKQQSWPETWRDRAKQEPML